MASTLLFFGYYLGRRSAEILLRACGRAQSPQTTNAKEPGDCMNSNCSPPTPPSDRDNSLLDANHAMRPQHEKKKENSAPSAQRAQLAKSVQELFMCGICFEKKPDNSIARPDPCGHNFCRECLRGHVIARLDERRFPILCPTCTSSWGKGKGVAGEVSQSLVLNLGLSEEKYSIWAEMEMAPISIVLHCRKCNRTMFVARDDHEKVNTIACPLPDCNHVWCKQCQRPVDLGGSSPKHSCKDGTSKLERLMKKHGWKYCPTCKALIQKISGCNHMSCLTPACNTHFCYVCGGLIVRSALCHEITIAKSAHYANGKPCSL